MENKEHRKHAKLPRSAAGEWARNELAILGAPCHEIRCLAGTVIQQLSGKWNIAFADTDHYKSVDTENTFLNGTAPEYRDKIGYLQMSFPGKPDSFERRALFNRQDLVLVNGNHFPAQQQIIVIDEAKPLDEKIDRLTDVVLIVLQSPDDVLPEYLIKSLLHIDTIPVAFLSRPETIIAFVEKYLQGRIPALNGLVLAGGKSMRMGHDKGLIWYHGIAQREHVLKMMEPFCKEVFLSCNEKQVQDLPQDARVIEDRFLGLGPLGGILSAMQAAPDNAWLAIACDLPHLDPATIQYLIGHRNPSKLATTFFNEPEGFPEPMVTIWEPRSYLQLLHFLSMGYSCPRKVLINSDIELLKAPDFAALQNVNDPEQYLRVVDELNTKN